MFAYDGKHCVSAAAAGHVFLTISWRSCLLLPELWTRFAIIVGNDVPFHKEFSTSALKRYLNTFAERSGNLSLDIMLGFEREDATSDDPEGTAYEQQFHDLARFLGSWPHNRRIRDLCIVSPCARYLLAVLRIPPRSFERLENVTILGCHEPYGVCGHQLVMGVMMDDVPGEGHDDIIDDNIRTFVFAPRLRTITFEQTLHLGYDATLEPETWDPDEENTNRWGVFVTHLQTGILEYSGFDDILFHCNTIQKAFFQINEDRPRDGIQVLHADTYEALEELALEYTMRTQLRENVTFGPLGIDCLQFLHRTHFPNLYRLQLILSGRQVVGRSDEAEPIFRIWPDRLDALSSSFPNLQEFALIFTWDLPTSDILALLSHFRGITTLKLLLCTRDYMCIIKFLTLSGVAATAAADCLPYLTCLWLDIADEPHEDHPMSAEQRAELFTDMVFSRRYPLDGSSANLKTVKLFVPEDDLNLKSFGKEVETIFDAAMDSDGLDFKLDFSTLWPKPQNQWFQRSHWEQDYYI
ncbi:hypothetical protein D9613_003753 [Agrocybe pediades]|uniref:Uncharacterized protein n=1 Tax=Agrocybe pediades TaxID=84607 RepID=A0A8H4QK74_9AGAR|nr:hypothetical protein D9613_003753 [Agrocybe pediades]